MFAKENVGINSLSSSSPTFNSRNATSFSNTVDRSCSISSYDKTRNSRRRTPRSLWAKAGTPRFAPEALKQEWYRLGTDFSAGAGDYETTFSISGLDANFGPSLKLMDELLSHPVVSDSTLSELVGITLAQRADSQKDNRTLSQALYNYNRLGEGSPYRRALSNQQLQELKKRMGK